MTVDGFEPSEFCLKMICLREKFDSAFLILGCNREWALVFLTMIGWNLNIWTLGKSKDFMFIIIHPEAAHVSPSTKQKLCRKRFKKYFLNLRYIWNGTTQCWWKWSSEDITTNWFGRRIKRTYCIRIKCTIINKRHWMNWKRICTNSKDLKAVERSLTNKSS